MSVIGGQSVGGVTRVNDDLRSVNDHKPKKMGKKTDPFHAIQFDESD